MRIVLVCLGFIATMSVLPAHADSSAPPAGSAKPAPTPADLAVQAVEQYGPDALSFSDKEFVLSMRDASPANKQAADKIWKSILAMEKGGKARLKIPVMVIAAGAGSLDAAISDDNQQAKRADLHVKLSKPAGMALKPGTQIYVIGVLSSYRIKPVVFIMDKGEVSAAEAPPAAASAH